MPNSGKNEPLLPWWGYVVLNALFLVILVAIYQLSRLWNPSSAGLGAILITGFACFLFASVVDYAWDRWTLREKLQRETRKLVEEPVSPAADKKYL